MFTIVGIKKVVSKKDGNVYYDIHLLGEDRFVEGQIAFSVFVRADQIENISHLCVGCISEILYNRFAKVERITVL